MWKNIIIKLITWFDCPNAVGWVPNVEGVVLPNIFGCGAVTIT